MRIPIGKEWHTLQQSVKDSVRSFQAHRLRTALTSLGVIFGVAAVISMLAIAEGAKQETLKSIELMGLNNIYIVTKELNEQELADAKKKNPTGLSLEDRDAVLSIVPGVSNVVPAIVESKKVSTPHNKFGTVLLGVTPEYFESVHHTIYVGRYLNWLDEESTQRVAVLGFEAAKGLFPGMSPINEFVRVNNIPFRVIGVLQKVHKTQEIPGMPSRDLNKEIYIPYSTMVQRVRGGMDRSRVNALLVTMESEDYIRNAASMIETILSRRHRGANDYNVVVPEELLAQSQKTQRMFTIIMGTIAGISLLVGGIGIMNIMLSSVLERTREIGLRRAVGATQKEIARQFLTESILLSGSGGIVGALIGIILAYVITWIAGWITVITIWSIFIALGVSVGVGVGFGLFPAKQAAQLDPIEALRYE